MTGKPTRKKKTTVGAIDADVLAYTAGEDVVLDCVFVSSEYDQKKFAVFAIERP